MMEDLLRGVKSAFHRTDYMSNNEINWQEKLSELTSKTMNELQAEAVRDSDSSKITREHTERMFDAIIQCEYHMEDLLDLTEEIGGFGSSYPKRCMDSLKLFRCILEMELKRL